MSIPDYNQQHMQLLLHAIEGINRTMGLKALLAKSMNSAQKLMNAEASSLMLVDDVTGELNVSIPTGPVGKKIKGLSIPKGKGISSWVLENRKPFVSNEPDKREEFWKELSPDFKTKSILCVPIINSADEAIGVLQALNKKDGNEFTEEDIQVFEAFASHVAIAIEKVREVDELKKKVQKRDDRLNEIHESLRNNLVTIYSFLQIEAEKIDDEKAEHILKSACSRILSVASAHYLLQNESEQEHIEIGLFINELFASISSIFLDDEDQVRILLEVEKVYMKADRALSLGLVVNEVLVLLFRYAFEDIPEGEVKVKIVKGGEEYVYVDISDNGHGVQIELAEEASGIDLTMVMHTLAESLNADLSIRENEQGGTTFSIKCPMEA